MGSNEPTHGEILRAIGNLEGQLRQLLDATRADNGERSSLSDRIGKLEQRMAQVVILAVVAATLSPLIWGELKGLFHHSATYEQRSTHHTGAAVQILARSTPSAGFDLGA